MEITTLLEYSERSQLRAWLKENHSKEKECWVVMSRSKTPPPRILPYIDIVEEALCLGWIDNTLKKLPDGRLAQRLSPRCKNIHWTKLNMDRCMDLEYRGLMTPAGRRAYIFGDKRERQKRNINFSKALYSNKLAQSTDNCIEIKC